MATYCEIWDKMCGTMTTRIFVIAVLLTAATSVDPNSTGRRIFLEPGVVWLDYEDGSVNFRHVFVDPGTWRGERKLRPVTIATTKNNTHQFTHMDVHFARKNMVMSDVTTHSIMARTFDDYGLHTDWELYVGTSTKVNGIAVDWVTDVVYWTDAAYDAILAVFLDMPNRAKVIIDTGLIEPYGIVAHPEKGMLFWTESSYLKPRLMRSSLGGRDISPVLRMRNKRPFALSMDYVVERLYWLYMVADGSGHGVGSCDLYGKNVVLNLEAYKGSFYDLDNFQNQLFLVQHHDDIGKGSIHIQTTQFRNPPLTLRTKGKPSSIRVLDRNRQFQRPNPCLMSQCPGLCTMSNFTENCFCINDLMKRAEPNIVRNYCHRGFRYTDFMYSEPFNGFLIPKADGIYTIMTNFIEYSTTPYKGQAKLTQLMRDGRTITALTSDIRANKIFFYESASKLENEFPNDSKCISFSICAQSNKAKEENKYQAPGEAKKPNFEAKPYWWQANELFSTMPAKIIKSIRITDGTEASVVSFAIGSLGGLAFDTFSRNLYWTDRKFGHIMVAREDGQFPVVIHRGLGIPQAIMVNSKRR